MMVIATIGAERVDEERSDGNATVCQRLSVNNEGNRIWPSTLASQEASPHHRVDIVV